MSKYLFILESPGKVKKIKSYLGPDFDVVASKGHVSDLPSKGLNIDLDNNFEPTFEVNDDKKDVVRMLKEKARVCDIIYLATDLDREGEGISWHIANELGNTKKIKRVRYNSITKNEIQKAIKEASDIDMALVDSYLTRRILDRLCGYRTSFLVKRATGG